MTDNNNKNGLKPFIVAFWIGLLIFSLSGIAVLFTQGSLASIIGLVVGAIPLCIGGAVMFVASSDQNNPYM